MRRFDGLRGAILCAAFLVATSFPGPAADAGVYRIRVGAGHPAGPSVYARMLRDYYVPEVRRRVAAETPHSLEVVEGYGGAIARVAEVLEAVEAGILDIGGYCVCFEPSKLFLHNFSYFTPFGPTDSEQAIRITREVYDANPWLSERFEERYGQKLIALNGWDNYHLGTVDPWEHIEDLRGVKIGGAGPNLPWLEYVGAIPVQSTLPDGYMAMQTGVYSGWLMFPSAYFAYKFHEPAPYYTLVDFGAMGGAVVITLSHRTIGRLPPEIVRILIETARAYEKLAAEALNRQQRQGLERLEAAGIPVRSLPPTERAAWARSLVGFPNAMAQDANRRGMPGSKVMRDYIETARRNGHAWPVEYVID